MRLVNAVPAVVAAPPGLLDRPRPAPGHRPRPGALSAAAAGRATMWPAARPTWGEPDAPETAANGEGGPAVLDRRRFLEAAAAAAGTALLAAGRQQPASAATVAAAAAAPPAGSDLGAIEHVVFLMQENRSFDHYYGTYPGVRGFNDHPRGRPGAFSQPYPANTTRPPPGRLLPYRLDTSTDIAECTHDLSHSWLPQHQCRAGGAMDAFVQVHTEPSVDGPEYGVLTMGYYTRADLPYYYALADAFTVCDGYHCSVMGPTHPNRLMALSGTVGPDGAHGGPVLITDPSPTARFSVSWSTMPEVLEDAGRVLEGLQPARGPRTGPRTPRSWASRTPSSPTSPSTRTRPPPSTGRPSTPSTRTTSSADVRQGTLPKVSWIIPPLGYDEHPPSPPALGEWLTDQVLRALVANRRVWSKTVLFHMYDENDGFFDHVPPPVPPPGTKGEYVTVTPLPSTAQGLAGPVGLGFRVPMLVLSPFSRGRPRVLRDLRPHLAAPVPRGALRGAGPQHLRLAAADRGQPHRVAAHAPVGPQHPPPAAHRQRHAHSGGRVGLPADGPVADP